MGPKRSYSGLGYNVAVKILIRIKMFNIVTVFILTFVTQRILSNISTTNCQQCRTILLRRNLTTIGKLTKLEIGISWAYMIAGTHHSFHTKAKAHSIKQAIWLRNTIILQRDRNQKKICLDVLYNKCQHHHGCGYLWFGYIQARSSSTAQVNGFIKNYQSYLMVFLLKQHLISCAFLNHFKQCCLFQCFLFKAFH